MMHICDAAFRANSQAVVLGEDGTSLAAALDIDPKTRDLPISGSVSRRRGSCCREAAGRKPMCSTRGADAVPATSGGAQVSG
jgi:hypothetical protein